MPGGVAGQRPVAGMVASRKKVVPIAPVTGLGWPSQSAELLSGDQYTSRAAMETPGSTPCIRSFASHSMCRMAKGAAARVPVYDAPPQPVGAFRSTVTLPEAGVTVELSSAYSALLEVLSRISKSYPPAPARRSCALTRTMKGVLLTVAE